MYSRVLSRIIKAISRNEINDFSHLQNNKKKKN